MVDDGVYDRAAHVNCLWNVAFNPFARRLRVWPLRCEHISVRSLQLLIDFVKTNLHDKSCESNNKSNAGCLQ